VTVGGRVGRLLRALVRHSARRPGVTLLLAALLTAGSLAVTLRGLGFVTSAYRLLPQHERYVVLLQEYLRDFGELNDILVAIEADDPERSKAFAAALLGEMAEAGVGARVTYRIDPGYFAQRGLLYLSREELAALRDHLLDHEEFIETYATRPTLARLLAALNQQIANAMLLSFFDIGLREKRADDLRFLESVLEQMAARLDGGTPRYVSPWATAFSLGRFDDPDAGYFFSKDRRLLFVFVQQRRTEGDFTANRALIEALRAIAARLGPAHPGVRVGVTGAPAISNDEMVTALTDSTLATVLATGATLLLLLVAFRRPAKPLLMLLALAASLAWTLGLVTLVIGHLTVFSVMFISLVIGIGIDYGIYLLCRYEEEVALGRPPARALERTAEGAGPGMLLGALTASGAFFVLVLTDFQGIREFGVVAGIAVLAAFAAMVTVFPASIALADRRRPPAPVAGGPPALPREARRLTRLTRHREAILVAAAALTLVSVWGARHIGFGYNMLKLQARGVDSVAWEERILATAGRSGFAAIATARDLEELRRKVAAFAALPSVSRVDSALLALPEDQPAKIRLIRELAPVVAPIRVGTPTALEPAALAAPLATLRRRLGLALEETTGEKTAADLRRLHDLVERVLARLGEAEAAKLAAPLAALQDQLYRDFADKLRVFRQSLDPRPIQASELPPELRQRYVGTSGRYLLRIQPAVDIWQRAGAERFVGELRSVDADVTGPPVTSFEAIGYIRRGYLEGTLYALVLVALVSGVLLRSFRGTLLALAPLALGVVWTLGFMHLFGLEFNLANVWALPLILGTAAEYGLNIFLRFLESRRDGGPVLARSVVTAVALNGLTTIVGFGSLMVAHHRGIFGLGLLLTAGATAALVASLVVLPTLLHLFAGRGDPAARPLPARSRPA
jgi:hypothetical protein